MIYIYSMKLDNTQAQMRRGVLELCILSLLDGEAMYTSDIIDRLSQAKLVVVEGTLYPLLTRLKNGGYLEYFWIESNAGPPRKYFRITTEGKVLLDDLKNTWQSINEAVLHTNTKQPTS